jgi:hypothetical protein
MAVGVVTPGERRQIAATFAQVRAPRKGRRAEEQEELEAERETEEPV